MTREVRSARFFYLMTMAASFHVSDSFLYKHWFPLALGARTLKQRSKLLGIKFHNYIEESVMGCKRILHFMGLWCTPSLNYWVWKSGTLNLSSKSGDFIMHWLACTTGRKEGCFSGWDQGSLFMHTITQNDSYLCVSLFIWFLQMKEIQRKDKRKNQTWANLCLFQHFLDLFWWQLRGKDRKKNQAWDLVCHDTHFCHCSLYNIWQVNIIQSLFLRNN